LRKKSGFGAGKELSMKKLEQKKMQWRQDVVSMKKIYRDPIMLFTILFIIAALLLFILYPLFVILKDSFLSKEGGFTFGAYISAVQTNAFKKAFGNTIKLGLFVGVIATLIAFIFAYTDAYCQSHFKKIFKVVALLPIASPPFVLSLSAVNLFGQYGLITRQLLGIKDFNIYGFKGVALAQILTFFPVAYLMLVGLLKKIDPSIEEASRNMGASQGATFKKITLPLMVPGLANAFLITFIEVAADFSNPNVIGGNLSTLATTIYMQVMGNYNMKNGAAIAVILLWLSMTLFIVEKYFVESKSYITVTGKSAKDRVLITDPKIVWPLDIFCLVVTLFIILMYAMVPIGACVKLLGVNNTFTLDNFRYVLSTGTKVIKDSVWLAVLAMPVAGVISMIIAFLVNRKRFIGRGFIEFVSLMAMAVPGTVLGLGYVTAYNTKPLLLTGTALLIVIAFIAKTLPIGVRNGIAALQQIDPAIEEAAQDLGASSARVFATITIPLIKPAFFNSLINTFVRSMTAVSTVIFLITPKYKLLTSTVMQQIDEGKFGYAFAYSTILMVIVMAAMWILNLVLGRFGTSGRKQSIL